jgi:hypothetical protein
MKGKLAIAALVIAGLAGSPFAAAAKSHKSKHTSSSSSSMYNGSTTTGANMKSRAPSDATGQGTVGPGGNNNGTQTTK